MRWKAQSAEEGVTFMVFRISGIPCGIYNMDFSFYTQSGGGEADIYILPAASLPSTTDAIHTLLDSMTAAGTVGNYKSGAVLSPSSIENAVFDGSIDGDYVVVFRSTTNIAGSAINTTTINLKSFTLTPAGSALSAAVESVVVAQDAVNASYYTFAATSVVNGSDYLYLCLKGGELWVYNVDTEQRVDNEELGFNTPRSIYVDEDGIIWICGNLSGLYRYDPFTGTGEQVTFAATLFGEGVSNTFGITGDGNGKLYFGTYADGYLGMYDTATETFSKISDLLNTDSSADADITHAGYGGLVVSNGYIYVGVDGDRNTDGTTTHAIIKYDIANQTIVDQLDISARLPSTSKYLTCLNLVGDVLFGSIFGRLEQSVIIDITGGDGGTDGIGDSMEFIEITDLPIGNTSEISEVINGKVYFSGYYGTSKVQHLVEYDVATQTVTPLLQSKLALRLTGGSMVTIADDERLPGQSIMVPVNNEANGTIDLSFYNPQTNQVVTWANFTPFGDGTGQTLRSLAVDPTGQNIYIGAYGCNLVSRYDLTAGEVTATFPSYDHQTDSLRYYNGHLYAGNYSAGTITQIDPDTLAATPLFSLRYTVFQQCRMHAFTAGDNKVFAGTTPYAGYGGVLVWHDLSTGLTYVAGGPNPEDVYYADTSNTDDPTAVDYTWYNAVTGEAADFDYDDDGTDDVYLADGSRRFSGPIPNQVINNIVYKDGCIYGTTSKYGSSGNDAVNEDGTPVYAGNAVLFVYDVAAKKVIATCDLATALTGITGVVPIIDQLAADPAVDGKFWGVVSGTLFSFTFNAEAKTFAVEEELSFLKNVYSLPGAAWGHRDIVFDGEYMYVAFGQVGTYMIRKSDPQENYQISVLIPNSMVLGADNNLYWITNSGVGTNLNMFPIAEAATAIKNAAAAGSES